MRAIHFVTAVLAIASAGCPRSEPSIVTTNAPDRYHSDLNALPKGASESTGSENGRGGGPSSGSSYTDGMPIAPAGAAAESASSAAPSVEAPPDAGPPGDAGR